MDSVKSVILIGLIAVGLLAMKAGKLATKLFRIKVEKGGYYCNKCGEQIIQGQGVVLGNKEFFFCIDCIKKGGR